MNYGIGDDAEYVERNAQEHFEDGDYGEGGLGGDIWESDAKSGGIDSGEVVSYQEALAAAAAERARLERAEPTTDTDPDTDAEPAGAGHRGRGPPLVVGHGPRKRDLCDGAGLCSPGLWAPRERPRLGHPRLLAIRAAIQRFVVAMDSIDNWSERLFERLSKGQVEESPLPEDEMSALAEYAMGLYDGDDAGGQGRGLMIFHKLLGSACCRRFSGTRQILIGGDWIYSPLVSDLVLAAACPGRPRCTRGRRAGASRSRRRLTPGIRKPSVGFGARTIRPPNRRGPKSVANLMSMSSRGWHSA